VAGNGLGAGEDQKGGVIIPVVVAVAVVVLIIGFIVAAEDSGLA